MVYRFLFPYLTRQKMYKHCVHASTCMMPAHALKMKVITLHTTNPTNTFLYGATYRELQHRAHPNIGAVALLSAMIYARCMGEHIALQ